jgi:hypothetical protein
MGPDFVIIESDHQHPAGVATIILKVDDHERSWNVYLPRGICADSKRVAIGAFS